MSNPLSSNPNPANYSTPNPSIAEKVNENKNSIQKLKTPDKEHPIENALNDIEIDVFKLETEGNKALGINPERLATPPSLDALPADLRARLNNIIKNPLSPFSKTDTLPPSMFTTIPKGSSTIINSAAYTNSSPRIAQVLASDLKHLMEAAYEFDKSGVLLGENQALSQSSLSLVNKHAELFTNPDALQRKYESFALLPENTKFLEGHGVSLNQKTPTFDLEGKGYHNIGHAKEMFADTYMKLFNQGLPETTCLAGATMAFFHDLVQGLDGFPQLGKNEDVTAKFLQYLINEDSGIDEETKITLHQLADATILGGTFLLKVKEGEQLKNMSVSQHMDKDNDLTSPSLDTLKLIRQTLAENDISRTLTKPEISNRNPSPLMERIVAYQNAAAHRLSELVEGNSITRSLCDASRQSHLGGDRPEKLISRLFQSIRMLTEFSLDAFPQQTFFSPSTIRKLRDQNLPDGDLRNILDNDPHIGKLVNKLKNPGSWIEQPFSEAKFAEQSDHNDYASMLKSHSSLITGGNEGDLKNLIVLALRDGQDGNSMQDIPPKM